MIDWLLYILIKVFGLGLRCLPRQFGLFLGRRLGDLLYYCDLKHKALAYANIKTAIGSRSSPCELKKITRGFYRHFGQSLMEIFFIPSIGKEYLKKYITFDSLDNIAQGFKRGKGVILLAMHEGSWEIYNIICANLGFPFSLFVRDQGKFRRVEKLLNSYRTSKGCKIIQRQDQIRQVVRLLKNNESIGMTIDQGGKTGALVKFFGRDASMATGAVKLALKYDCAIIPAYFVRLGGSYVKIIIDKPFELTRSGDKIKDLQDNLQRLISFYEKYIALYPKEYLWTYKTWKYGRDKKILILSDGKAGHLRQSEALAKIAGDRLKEKGIQPEVQVVEVKFKSGFSRASLAFSSFLAGKYHCQGCLWCLRTFLTPDTYQKLVGLKPDIVISCGSSLEPVNYVLSRDNLAKSVLIMKPSVLGVRRFNLVIIPRHDKPARRKNLVITEGALNLIDEDYLKEQSESLIKPAACSLQPAAIRIGLLLGGDTKDFRLNKNTVAEVISGIKSAAEKLGADILVTTSRRTSKEIEDLVKDEFKDYPRCKLLVIANEKNIPEAVGGILGLSQAVVASPESISMVSEAVSSRKYVLVFKEKGLDKKHASFLESSAGKNYIYMIESGSLAGKIEELLRDKPPVPLLKDRELIARALDKIL